MTNIAGIYGGPGKNVLGLMPHPERMSEWSAERTAEVFDALLRADALRRAS